MHRLLEIAQHLVAAFDRSVERLLRALLAGQRLFAFLLDDGTDLRHAAKMEATRIVGDLTAG